jgi:hypothetical protein
MTRPGIAKIAGAEAVDRMDQQSIAAATAGVERADSPARTKPAMDMSSHEPWRQSTLSASATTNTALSVMTNAVASTAGANTLVYYKSTK